MEKIYNIIMNKHSAFLVCALSAAFIFSGCGGAEKYGIYTNIPQNVITLTAGNFGFENKLETTSFIMQNSTPAPEKFTVKTEEFYAMNAHSVLVVAADFGNSETAERFELLKSAVGELLLSLDLSLSATQTGSCVYNFNSAPAGSKVVVDANFYNALTAAKYMHSFTEAAYNPAVYDCVQAFGFLGADRPASVSELPSEEKCSALARVASHFSETELIAENGEYYAVKPLYTEFVEGKEYNLKLDLGGIGKGYAVDLIDGLLDEYGFEYGYFNFASSSMVCKSSAGNGNYTVTLRNPRGSGNYLKLLVNNAKISTSGDYFLSYILDGKRYSSVISPKTGKPIETGVITATVIGGSAAENDALTTALMVMGREKASVFVSEKLLDRQVVFVCEKV